MPAKPKPFSEQLRAARGTRSRPEAAAILGLHPNTLKKWEEGRSEPPAEAALTQGEIIAKLKEGGEP